MKEIFFPSRLVFQHVNAEIPGYSGEAAESPEKEKNKKVQNIEPNVDDDNPDAQKIFQRHFLEEMDLAHKYQESFHLEKSDNARIQPDGSIEQSFTFGEKENAMQGKITFPKPPLHPDKKLTIVYSFTDAQNQLQHGEIWESLEKQNKENIVFISLQTRKGAVKIGKDETHLLQAITKDLEKIPKLKADQMLIFADPESTAGIHPMLEQYQNLDPRLKVFFEAEIKKDYNLALETFLQEAAKVPGQSKVPSSGEPLSRNAGTGLSDLKSKAVPVKSNPAARGAESNLPYKIPDANDEPSHETADEVSKTKSPEIWDMEGYKESSHEYHEFTKNSVISNIDGLGSFEPVRLKFNMAEYDPKLPTEVVVFATASGRNPETTEGSMAGDASYRYQLTAPQLRRLRQDFRGKKNIVAVYMTPRQEGWNNWEKQNPNRGAILENLIETIKKEIVSPDISIDLSGCSGGGSLMYELMRHYAAIPSFLQKIHIFDANYNYIPGQMGDWPKYRNWLVENPKHILNVISGDTKNHEKFEMMKQDIGKDFPFTAKKRQGFTEYVSLNGQIHLIKFDGDKHHGDTVLDGFDYAMTIGTEFENSDKYKFKAGARSDLAPLTDSTVPEVFHYS